MTLYKRILSSGGLETFSPISWFATKCVLLDVATQRKRKAIQIDCISLGEVEERRYMEHPPGLNYESR